MKIAVLVLLLHLIKCIRAGEVDVLTALKNKLTDPDNNMQSWDPTLTTPCTWFHITCDPNNSVIRVDLGKANVSGQLVPELGQLKYLQYLELYMNNISGSIPEELGNSSSLVSLDLYQNKLYGPIPDWLGGLTNLRFLRLNNNGLTGSIPKSLTEISTLAVLDLSCNDLSGTVPLTGSFLKFTPVSFRNNPQLCYPGVTCP